MPADSNKKADSHVDEQGNYQCDCTQRNVRSCADSRSGLHEFTGNDKQHDSQDSPGEGCKQFSDSAGQKQAIVQRFRLQEFL